MSVRACARVVLPLAVIGLTACASLTGRPEVRTPYQLSVISHADGKTAAAMSRDSRSCQTAQVKLRHDEPIWLVQCVRRTPKQTYYGLYEDGSPVLMLTESILPARTTGRYLGSQVALKCFAEADDKGRTDQPGARRVCVVSFGGHDVATFAWQWS